MRSLRTWESLAPTPPPETLQAAYPLLHIPFDDRSRTAVAQWASSHKAGQHGTHVSNIEDFGLDSQHVRAAFGRYTERFGALLS